MVADTEGERGDVGISDTPSSDIKSTNNKNTDTESPDDAVIHLLTQEGSAPIYHEFFTILESTFPKLDVLQQLHAMQAWLYINPDKRKPFEHIGHFVNGVLRRSTKANKKQRLFTAVERTKGSRPIKSKTPRQQTQVTPITHLKRALKPLFNLKTLVLKPLNLKIWSKIKKQKLTPSDAKHCSTKTKQEKRAGNVNRGENNMDYTGLKN